jgi:hypothetical protein
MFGSVISNVYRVVFGSVISSFYRVMFGSPQNLTKRCIYYEKPSAEEFDPANPFSPVYQVLAGDMSKKKYMPV